MCAALHPTHHTMSKRPPNRLAKETSPYLLQHQDNPVDWYPWGEEAFTSAREKDLPILLSVGYSSCHWCHVMERESFDDEEVAALMNEWFINVKVDREERPDVDSLYMTAVQRITGQGGWPMTVFLTPEGEPFYGGTYFPPVPRHGLPSFRQLLQGIHQAWTERRDEVRRSAEELTTMLREGSLVRPPAGALDHSTMDAAFREIARRHDSRWGGFGGAPKFPQPLLLDFLLRYHHRTGSAQALEIVRHSLRGMARGGIYDHLGGGFHRYSVDAKWLVPHFEKMLYDNALLSRVYLNAYLATGEDEFRYVTEDVLRYVLREMTGEDGGFFSAQDADSEGEEGKSYLWTAPEIDKVLGEEGPQIRQLFGVREGGNFEGRSILNLIAAERERIDPERDAHVAEARAAMELVRSRLLGVRDQRVQPHLDDKVITAWNAMMMRSFAEAGRALDRPDYTQTAVRNAEFLQRELRQNGQLLRTFRQGEAKIPAFLDDHALLVDALVSLYQATFDSRWVSMATEVADAMLQRFWSPDEETFYDTAEEVDDLIVRPREMNDSATPSGTSAAATALLRLGALTGSTAYLNTAEKVVGSLAEMAQRFPQAFGEMLIAIDLYLDGIQEVAIVGPREQEGTRQLLDTMRSGYWPRAVTAFRAVDNGAASDIEEIPLLQDREPVNGAAAAYVCRRFTCQRPVTSADDLRRSLQEASPSA